MEEKSFVWTSELTERMLQLRFEKDWLFKTKKQPWGEFYKILLDNGFSEKMTIKHVRKKWSYVYDMYRQAKRTKNREWKYYKIFDKHYGKTKILDKYESWSDEWRLKLIICITEAKSLKLDFLNMWKTVESALRCQDLPIDCCIQDIKELWHHLKTTFNRKHRLKLKKGEELTEWPLYEPMMNYFKQHDPDHLVKLATESSSELPRPRKSSMLYLKKNNNKEDEEIEEFQWSKDITESFIQVRLQNDWLFRERKWAWNDLMAIMVEEYGFPKTITGRDISKKWASTFAEYQKAKATNNKSWVYYTLFELYLGEGSLSLNPLVGWQEEWVFNLISARTDSEHLFKFSKDQSRGWREVEKRLRSIGLPLDHSLLDLPEIWIHLLKTFKWKRKFADKGILNEQWPYFEAMAEYVDVQNSEAIKTQKEESMEQFDDVDDDFEDDMKLHDLKRNLLQVRPKAECLDAQSCRSCYNEDGCINLFEHKDDHGVKLAYKLKIIGGVEVNQSDSLPAQICLNCVRDLENAYNFRKKCQEADTRLRCRNDDNKVKIEVSAYDPDGLITKDDLNIERDDNDHLDDGHQYDESDVETKSERRPLLKKEKKVMMRRRKKIRKMKYDYWKICEVCGKHTKNLLSHLDMHSSGKYYSCDVCDKKFKFKSGLVVHRAVHDPTPKKTCEVCGKTFHILAQYRRHFVYHANERKYGCETCGKRFNTLDILRVHNRTHTDERPFSCQECGKTFRTAGCVSRHKRIVHRNVKAQ